MFSAGNALGRLSDGVKEEGDEINEAIGRYLVLRKVTDSVNETINRRLTRSTGD